jgi:NitT/TauT family transport system permease protein/sulfonate transport system permease protein
VSRLLRNLALPVATLGLWELLGRTGHLPDFLSTPSGIAAAFAELIGDGELGDDVAISVLRAFSGFAIGAALGVLVGLAAGISAPVRNFFDAPVSLLYPVPKIAFYPIFLLWLGLGDMSKIVVVAVSVWFPVFIASIEATRTVNLQLIWSAQSMGAGRFVIFRRVVLPAALPQLFAGLRVGLALAFVALFAAELMGANAGLGYLVTDGEQNLRFDIMFAGIVTFGVIGFLSDRVLLAVRRRLLRGQLIGTAEAAV